MTVNDVVIDDELTAVGFLRRPVSDDEDDDEDVVDPRHRTFAAKFEDDFTLAAVTLELGANVGRLEQLLRGQITSVNTASGTLQLLVGTADRCVNARNAEIFLISDKDGLESRRGQLADLKAGRRADVYGVEGIDGCFVASDILADDRP